MPKVVAITGGGQGIGRAIAYAFADAGYAVSIADPVADGGEEALAHLKMRQPTSIFEACDISQKVDIERWIGRTVEEIGIPDVLVNNAAILANGPFLDLSAEDFDRVLAVNVRGTLLCTQAVARALVNAKRGGSIVNIASTRALMSEPNTEAYSASKGAIVALTHATAMSLGPMNIRVNCVSPGWIETSDWQYSGRARTPKHSQRDRKQHPVMRVGVPGDIAEACLFLSRPDSFITGQNFVIDGGMTKKMIYE
ncbi:glucose 1-dehydrogenase [Pseudorhodoplanes sinuspersici]|uniref:Oxidoreductase n=1 Tax=Pseudorhodoplanes sinuspersici TaxID=1235591 RepID=A0A1W6ZYG7_9HYPH|nr:glucose 1-dehydrogenase [Pseudorhodoplanes sinuspersici]ARQ02363.1 oxidoreductase [Pseudorhodoplanes sinuspersici]RKE74192.1 NAD(P)-dependent dehydrogenase (short-subunit alcohol dehydrogenase family) [Pseudorhodoplanes sinuspersici]